MQPATSPVPPKRPSAAGLWIGAAIIVAGIVLGAVLVVRSFVGMVDTIDDYQRVSSRTGGALVLDAGRHTIFYERPEETGGLAFSISPNLQVFDPDGERVALGYSGVSETYDIGSRHGRRLATIEAPVSGRYEFRVGGFRTDDGSERGFGEFAVGRKGPLSTAGPAIAGGILGGLGLVVVGGLVMIISGVRRGRARRAIAGLPGPGNSLGGWPPPPATWGGGGPGWSPPGTQAPGGWPPPPGPPPPVGPPGWVPPPAPPQTGPPPPGSPPGGNPWPPQ